MNRAIGISFLFLILLCGASPVRSGVFEQTGHGNRQTGVMRDPFFARGSCRQCHVEGDGRARHPKGLWRPNDNELCFTCHQVDDLSGLFPGRQIYQASSHNIDPRVIWPGPFPPARTEPDGAGKCLNCHTPHGSKDSAGMIPSLMTARQETLCLSCHDGEPASTNIARETRKPYSHLQAPGAHHGDEAVSADPYSFAGGNRHVGCGDCHNPHAAAGDPAPPVAPNASTRLARVSRVAVMNGAPGTIPRYVFLPANDISTPVLEYEICYKCHSSWTQQPPGQEDIALLMNTSNASFHPVEGTGKNPAISPDAFVGGLNSFSTILCSDCHGSDDSDLRGPHGSLFPNILKGAYEARSTSRISTAEDLCFDCHSFATYADALSLPMQQDASRFNQHALHVGQQNVPCYACHESHGSPQHAALIATGRMPGLQSFSMTATGGSCQSTCHDAKSYAVTYPR